MLRIANPLAWTKNWFLAASHFCKLRASIRVCHMVYFASLRHIDEPRCIARYFTLIHFLQNLHEPSISNSSRDIKQFIFAQINKQWLFLSSTAHSRSLYFAAAYRLAMFRPTCKKSKMKHSPASHNKRARKSKKQKYPNPKNRRAGQWSHFLSRSNSSTHHVASSIFLRECAQAKRVASQQHNKKLCSLFLKCLCLLWYVLYYALLP